MMVDALVAVGLRNTFYREGQRRAITIFLLSLSTNFLLLFILVYLVMHPPAPKYFSVGINGRVTPLLPNNKPNQSDDAVLRWGSGAATASFSYSYVNYREELQASSGFFTGSGWEQFLRALKDSNNLEAVTEKRMVVSAQIINQAKVVKKELIKDSYSWRIEVPILVTYQNDTEYTQQYNLVSILISRVSILNAPMGIGIEQLVVSPITNGT
jgi:intracellular multiplication protein IcmL